jgi:hypothetical protein
VGDVAGGVVTVTTPVDYLLKVGDKVKWGNNTAFVVNITRNTAGQVTHFTVSGGSDATGAAFSVRKNVGEEPTVDGKYLEENVRMSLPSTSDVYAIHGGQGPILKGQYAQVTFTMKDNWNDGGKEAFAAMKKKSPK